MTHYQKKENIYTQGGSAYYLFSLLIILNISRAHEYFRFLIPLKLQVGLLFVVLLMSLLKGDFNLRRLSSHREIKVMFLLWFLGLLIIPFSVWPGAAFISWRTTFTYSFLLFIICMCQLKNSYDVKRATWALVLSVAILIFAGFMSVSTHRFYIMGSSYDPNDLALLTVTIFPIVIYHFLYSRIWKKFILLLLIFAMILLIMETGSRGGVLGLASTVFAILLYKINKISFAKKGLLVIALTVFILVFIPNDLKNRFASIYSGEDYNLAIEDTHIDEGGGGRLAIWLYSMEYISNHPLIGAGAGQSSVAMGIDLGRYGYRTVHNSFLQVGMELGLPGLILFFLILFFTYKNCNTVIDENADSPPDIKDMAQFIKISLIGFFVCSLFLSQAYSLIPVLLLSFSTKLKHYRLV